MKIVHNHFSLRISRWARSKPVIALRAARHLHWARALSAGFLRKSGLPVWRSTMLSYLFPARRWALQLQRVLDFRPSSTHLNQTLLVTNSFPERHTSVGATHQLGHGYAPSRVPVQFATSQSFQQAHITRTHTFSMLEKISERRIWLPAHASSEFSQLGSRASITNSDARKQVTPPAVDALHMTTRIMRQLQRVEERQLAPEHMRVSTGSASAESGFVLEAPARRPRHAALGATQDFAVPGALPAAVNVNHLTDEVMRQLDRRLISVRERMGKI